MNADELDQSALDLEDELDSAPEIGVDVLVLTALKDELDGLLAVRDGWAKTHDARGFPYHRCTLPSGLRVAAAWIGEMGQTAAMSRGKDLVRELDPQCLAMSGICAGDPAQVSLGDLIVADRLWPYAEGKQVAGTFYHSMKMFRVERTWGMNAAYVKEWLDLNELAQGRPPSKDAQTRWLLHTLYAHQFEGGASPADHPDRKTRCPAFADIVKAALEKQLVVREGRTLRLTDTGKDKVDEDALMNPDGIPSEKPHAIHIGAMATGPAVIKDEAIFPRLRMVVRETMALDMEGAAIAQLADEEQKKFLVVKAVQDYANTHKDDTFRAFGCRASAKFLLAFLEKHLEHRKEADVPRPIQIDTHKREEYWERGRENPFVRRVREAASLRHPNARIVRRRVQVPFAGALELRTNEDYLDTVIIVALDEQLTDDHWRLFCADIQEPARRRDSSIRFTLVHRGETSPSGMVEDAAARRTALRTFREYQGLFDLKPYLEWQTTRLLNAENYPSRLYVDAPAKHRVQGNLDWTKIDDALQHLWDLLAAPAQKRFALIIGDFGAGKTFLLRELARRMHQENHQVWPVLLEMRWLEKRHQLSELIGAHFSKADVRGYNFRAFQYMLEQGRIALLFDGFDELVDRVTYDTVTDHFRTVLSATQGEQAKVVLSSRRQHFLSETQAMVGLAEQAQGTTGFRLILLEEFKEAQIRRYLRNALGDEQAAAERYKLIDEVKDLLGLSHNPRMLGFIAQISEDELRRAKARKSGELTSADLYQVLIKEWLDHEYKRLKGFATAKKTITRENLDQGVRALALAMWQKKQKTCDIEDIQRVLSQSLIAPDEVAVEPELLTHLFGSGSLLVRDRFDESEGCFSFVHRSVLEWLVARVAADQLSSEHEPECLAADEMTPLMADFFCHSVNERQKVVAWARSKVSDRLDGTTQKNATLVLQRLKESQHAVVLAGQDLRGKDFTGIDWRNADLRGTNLEGATLLGANLTGANLEGARLARAQLTNAKLVGANLHNADLRVTRLLNADLTDVQGLDSAIFFRTNLAGAIVPESLDIAKADPCGVGTVLHRAEPAWAGATMACASVAWEATGELLAAGFADGTVRIYDARSGELLRLLAGHTKSVTSVAFSPIDKLIASGSDDNSVRLWDAASGREIGALEGHTHWVVSVAFSPDGKTVASGSYDKTVRLWDVASRRPMGALQGPLSTVTCVAFSPDGKMIASSSDDSSVRLWDAASHRSIRVLQGHTKSVLYVAFSPDSQIVASCSSDSTVLLWDAASGRPLRALEGHTKSVKCVAFSPNGKTLVSGSSGNTARLWDVASGRPLRSLEGHMKSVRSVAFSPDGQTVATGSSDDSIRLWDASSGRSIRSLQGHTNSVASVAFSADGNTIATGSYDNTLRLWDAASGRSIRVLQGHTNSVSSVAFSPDGRFIVSSSYDRTVRMWEASSGREICEMQGHAQAGYTHAARCVAFSPDGTMVASGSSDKTVRLLDAATGRPVRTLEGHSRAVWSVAFSRDGGTIASGSEDRTIRVWDATSGRAIRTLEGHANTVRSVAFSPDGKTIASGSEDKSLRLWDVSTGRFSRVLDGHTNSAWSVAFSPDGKTIASGSYDKTLRLWDVASGSCVGALEGHSSALMSVAFGPGGTTVASGALDGTVRVWDVQNGRCLAVLFATADGWAAFSPDGRYKYGGNIRGSFWHVVGLCRFELGELPALQLPDDADFRALPPMPEAITPVTNLR